MENVQFTIDDQAEVLEVKARRGRKPEPEASRMAASLAGAVGAWASTIATAWAKQCHLHIPSQQQQQQPDTVHSIFETRDDDDFFEAGSEMTESLGVASVDTLTTTTTTRGSVTFSAADTREVARFRSTISRGLDRQGSVTSAVSSSTCCDWSDNETIAELVCRFPRGTTGYPEVVGVTTTKQSGEGPVQGPNDASPLSPEDMSKAKDLLSPLDFTVGDTLVGLNVDLGSGNIDMGSEHFASVMKNAPKVKTIGPETTILAVFNLDHKGSSIYCNWLLVNLQKEGDVTDQSNTVYSWDFSTDQLPADITQGSRFVAVAVTQDGGKFDMEEIKKKATEDKRLGFTGKELSGSTIFFDNLPKKFLRMAKPGLVTGLKNWVICADGNPGCQVAGEFNGQQTGGSTGGMDGMSSLMGKQ
ncbi:unnamed protein product [Notodromas monacha]|uniref:Uncharacterized protein n=1 Tax=Notodromas monacha TaxID=399045 RepID=A0A7R9GDD9_9CRUS|nr:unnamed protein product [Notodromas monacha]CAG0918444.1 unnamed protein product [Notodromas monacha]